MDFATLAVWAALLLVGVALVAVVIFGIKSIAEGKFRMTTLAAMVVPVVVFVIAYALSSGAEAPFAAAAVLTSLILIVIAAGAILVIGLKGLIGF